MQRPLHSFTLLKARALRHHSRGFTFTELVVTVAVLAVLLTLAASSFAAMGASTRLTNATNSFVAHLHVARSEAIKRNQRVAMCKSADGVTCNTGGGWHQGWLVFHDANNNGIHEADEAVIDKMPALTHNIRVMGNMTVAGYVSYAPSGAAELVGGGFQAGTITICRQSPEATDARKIVLNAGGRPRVQKTTVDLCA